MQAALVQIDGLRPGLRAAGNQAELALGQSETTGDAIGLGSSLNVKSICCGEVEFHFAPGRALATAGQLSDELVDTLEMLRHKVNPDQIIIETSGVALPGDTQVNLWREPAKSWIAQDVAVVVVSAEQVLAERDLEGTFEYQLTSADLLVLNQLDLVPADALPAIEARLREIEPEAPMVRSVHGQVDAAVLFPPDFTALREQRRHSARDALAQTHESFTSEVVAVETGIDEATLVARFRAIGALRAKGFVYTAAGPRLLQGVGGRVQLYDVAEAPDAALMGAVVVIRRSNSGDMLSGGRE